MRGLGGRGSAVGFFLKIPGGVSLKRGGQGKGPGGVYGEIGGGGLARGPFTVNKRPFFDENAFHVT